MIHLRLEAREDEDVTVWDYCGKVEGYEVPARLTVETEDGVLAETFEGSIALDEDLQYAFNSYVRLVVEPRESLRDRFEGIAESCAEPRSYWLALYDPDGNPVLFHFHPKCDVAKVFECPSQMVHSVLVATRSRIAQVVSWFFRDRATDVTDGTEEEGEESLPELAYAYLERFRR